MRIISIFWVVVGFVVVLSVGPAPAQDFDRGYEAYQSGDFVTAMREWKPLANQGDVDAQVQLGFMYDKGQGVPLDHAAVAKWFG